MPPSPDRTAKPLLAVAAAVLAGGAALAILQPGDLGGDEGTAASATTATTAASTTATTTAASTTATTSDSGAVTVTTGGSTTATTGTTGSTTATTGTTAPTTGTTGTTVAPTTATTSPGSGLGNGGASRADDGTADTGIESMLGPGLALVAAAGALRGAARRR